MNKNIFVLLVIIALIKADERLVVQEFNTKLFNNDATNGWAVVGNKQSNLISVCESENVFGGYNVFGKGASAEKQFSSGVNHSLLKISFDLYAIDSWDNEVFSFKVDDNTVYTYTTNAGIKTPAGNRQISCGSSNWSDKFVQVYVEVPHNRKTFKLNFSSTLDQDANDESWGIKNLQIVAVYPGENSVVISEEFTSVGFQQNSKGWITSQQLPTPFGYCDKEQLFGGYSIFGQKLSASKQFTDLHNHYAVQIDVTVWFIDNVEAKDYLSISLDGQEYRIFRSNYVYTQNQICGDSKYGENVQRISLLFPHVDNQFVLTFEDSFDQNKTKKSWGIQDLVVQILTGKSDKQVLASREFDENKFTSASGWTSWENQDVSKSVSTCGGSKIFGGPKTLESTPIQKVYNNLPGHSNIRIFFNFYSIDSWGNDIMRIYVDNVEAKPVLTPYQKKSQICGVSYNDDHVRNYFVDIPHTGAKLKLAFKFEQARNTRDSSFGIRNLIIWTYYGPHTKVISQEFNDNNNFNVKGWETQPNLENKVSNCGEYNLFGGYGVFGLNTIVKKKYQNLPNHSEITITFKLFFIDTWDKEDFIVWIDGQEALKKTKSDTWGGQEHICGWTAAKEEVYTVQVKQKHSKNELELSFGDKLNQSKNDESWGIRDLVVAVSNSNRYEDEAECVIIYNQCNFSGKQLQVCRSIPDLASIGWADPIRSLQVPENLQANIYEEANYQGEPQQILKTEKCLEGAAFVAINEAFGINVQESQKGEQNNNLKRQTQ